MVLVHTAPLLGAPCHVRLPVDVLKYLSVAHCLPAASVKAAVVDPLLMYRLNAGIGAAGGTDVDDVAAALGGAGAAVGAVDAMVPAYRTSTADTSALSLIVMKPSCTASEAAVTCTVMLKM